jgi:multiple sugar transport system permease protein
VIRRGALAVVIIAVVVMDLVPPALVLKQAFTPEAESFAWPPTWLPRAPTLENVRALGDTVELARGLELSALVAVLTVVVTLAVALPAAWAAARERGVARGLDVALVLARVFPTIALAIPLATLFIGVGLYNSPVGAGLVLAHALIALPVAVLVLRSGFRAVPPDLEDAALLDGASRLAAFRHVALPLVRPSLGAAAVLVFLLSWDEFGFALLLQVTNRPLPPLVYYLSAFGHPGLASAVAAAMLVPAIAIVFLLEPAFRSGVVAGSGR